MTPSFIDASTHKQSGTEKDTRTNTTTNTTTSSSSSLLPLHVILPAKPLLPDSYVLTQAPHIHSPLANEVATIDTNTSSVSPTDPLSLDPNHKVDPNNKTSSGGKLTGSSNKSWTRSQDPTPLPMTSELGYPMGESTSHSFNVNSFNTYNIPGQSSVPISRSSSASGTVKETNRVHLEYDPVNKRKILNTYEILREIGRGEHGKVKLAKDLEHNELVAIKIVSRKSKKNRPTLRFKHSPQDVANASDRFIHKLDDYEKKIKREIAIMKKCDQKHIVKLREVLDDKRTFKIYLVLEYMEKGEIKWKKTLKELHQCKNNNECGDDEIPCVSKTCAVVQPTTTAIDYDDDDDYLLSETYAPNLTFKQSRKIFRDVLLGLEYLHKQGIVHRDIKPANLLVSADNVVKISDFGVSFASSLNSNDEGVLMNELELAKTAGTPAFFAPELCQTNFSGSSINLTKNIPPNNINYKIDIWALGVTLYCLLFGKVPFNADSEFKLFQVIVNDDLKFPVDRFSFSAPTPVSQEEFDLAKDLLTKLLDKNSATRWDIAEIKQHPFTLMDLNEGTEEYNDFFHLNDLQNINTNTGATTSELQSQVDLSSTNMLLYASPKMHSLCPLYELDTTNSSSDNNSVVGLGARVKKSLFNALKNGMTVEKNSSTESSEQSSHFNSKSNLFHSDPSIIISETPYSTLALNTSNPDTPPPSSPIPSRNVLPSGGGGGGISLVSSPCASAATTTTGLSPFPVAGIRDRNILLLDVIESEQLGSRRSSVGIISEAPQVETKRNAVGDVYLRNQSIVDTFKDIQEQDERRRSSVLSGLKTTSSNPTGTSSILSTASSSASTPKPFRPSISSDFTPSSTSVPSQPINRRSTCGSSIDDNVVTVKVGPIDINKSRRGSSVISLPVSESFASLDSIDDDYLALKYQDYIRSKGKDPTDQLKSRRGSEVTQSDTALFKQEGLHNASHHHIGDSGVQAITDKLRNFNMTTSMNSEPESKSRFYRRTQGGFAFDGDSDDDEGAIGFGGPKSKPKRPPMQPPQPPPMLRNRSSSSSCSSYSSSGGDESDGDGGNLTLAFTAKVDRPQMFGLDSRVRSHESNLPGLVHTPSYPDVPIIFQDQIPEFEDVPEMLMEMPSIGNSTSSSIAMGPSVSIISSTGSQTTITPSLGYNNNNSTTTALKTPQTDKFVMPPSTPEVLGTLSISHSPMTPKVSGREFSSPQQPPQPPVLHNVFRPQRKIVTSPLGRHEPVSAVIDSINESGTRTESSPGTGTGTGPDPTFNLDQTQVAKKTLAHLYNNHYKKEPLRFPFPNALHYDQEKISADHRPSTKAAVSTATANRLTTKDRFRSNSITIGILQHEPLNRIEIKK